MERRTMESGMDVARRPRTPAEAVKQRQRDARRVAAKLEPETLLTLDDSDFGTDPYNRTGRFTALRDD